MVKSFTNTGLGVYYDDNRTNIRCKYNYATVKVYGYDSLYRDGDTGGGWGGCLQGDLVDF